MSAVQARLDVPGHGRRALDKAGSIAVPVLSVLAALALWELISRTDTISQRDLPAMSTTVQALWGMLQTSAFWIALGHTVRGWAIGLGLAIVLAVPIGITSARATSPPPRSACRSSSSGRSRRRR